MNKSSKTISLALVGATFLLGGCGSDQEAEEEGEAANQERTRSGHGGLFIAPRIGGGMGGGRGGMSPSPSARGGFGATGSASVGS